MNIKVMGSGGWEGVPAAFCSCAVCTSALQKPASKEARTRPGFLINTPDNKPFLLEVGPDIRMQSAIHQLPDITDILVSHAHFDHMGGLPDLHSYAKRLQQKLRIHCSVNTAKNIQNHFSYLPLEIRIVEPYQAFDLNGIHVTPLPIRHVYADENNVPGSELNTTYAYAFEASGKKVVYLADYFRVPQKTQDFVRGGDAVIADGTYLFTDAYRDSKQNHMHGDDIIEFTSSLGAKSVYYFSITHLSRKSHAEMQKLLPSSHFITYDGMNIEP